jgi:hypothetical protein
VRMSAQETVWLQIASTWVLMLSMTLKPSSEPLFAGASCSLPDSRTDASQPCSQIEFQGTKRVNPGCFYSSKLS